MKQDNKSLKILWFAIGQSQLIIIAVSYFFLKKKISDEAIIQEDITIPLVLCSVAAVMIGIIGQSFYKNAVSAQDEKNQQTYFVISWALAELISIIGVIGLAALWNDISNSFSFWICGLILWGIRYPRLKQ